MEVVNIKQCKNLSTSGIYNVKYTDLNSTRINVLVDNNEKINNPENQISIRTKESSANQIDKKLNSKKKDKI